MPEQQKLRGRCFPVALHFYFDEACTNQVSEGDGSNPDVAIGNGTEGFTDERPLWIKNDDPTKEYKAADGYPALRITTLNDDEAVDVQYAEDDGGKAGAYSDTLDLPDGAYTTPYKIWRRVTVQPGTPEQNRVDIKHQIRANRFAI